MSDRAIIAEYEDGMWRMSLGGMAVAESAVRELMRTDKRISIVDDKKLVVLDAKRQRWYNDAERGTSRRSAKPKGSQSDDKQQHLGRRPGLLCIRVSNRGGSHVS